MDASGRLWADYEEEGSMAGLNDAETNKAIPALHTEDALGLLEGLGVEPCLAQPGFAVGPHDEAFYVGHEREDGLEECREHASAPTAIAKFEGSASAGIGKPLVASLDRESATGVATNQATGEVYVNNGTSIAAFTADGRFSQRFGSGQLSGAGALAVDAQTDEVFVAEEHQVAVFKPEEAGTPVVDGVSARVVSANSAQLSAQIDPRGERSEYEFQYGTADCAETPSSCATVPVPAGEIAAVFGDQSVSVRSKACSRRPLTTTVCSRGTRWAAWKACRR